MKQFFLGLISMMALVGAVAPISAADEDPEAAMAQALLEKAVALIEKEGPINAFYQFNTNPADFTYGEIYVWAISMDGIIFAHSSDPTMVGLSIGAAQDAANDPNAKQRAEDLVNYAASRQEGKLEYDWFNPVSEKAEHKHSFFKRIDVPNFRVDFIVLTGYFTPNQ